MQKEWLTTTQTLTLLQIKSRTSLYKFVTKYNIRLSKPMGRVYYNNYDILETFGKQAVTMGI